MHLEVDTLMCTYSQTAPWLSSHVYTITWIPGTPLALMPDFPLLSPLQSQIQEGRWSPAIPTMSDTNTLSSRPVASCLGKIHPFAVKSPGLGR